MKLKDALWIWGQDAGSHHACKNNQWNLPGENRMGPLEGCRDLGIENCCRVIMNGLPEPPYDAEADKLQSLNNVVWSLIGDAGSVRNNESTDLEEIIRIAKDHPNIVGAIMDDFMNPTRMKIFTPPVLEQFRTRLHTALPDRSLKLWTVFYEVELSEIAIPYLKEVDNVTLWTWHGKNLVNLEENLAKCKTLTDKPIYTGCYFFNYGDKQPLTMELMKLQLDTYYRWLKEGKIRGIIFCSNAVQDIGLPTVDYAKEWISLHGEEELPF